jgi:cell division protein FtsN
MRYAASRHNETRQLPQRDTMDSDKQASPVGNTVEANNEPAQAASEASVEAMQTPSFGWNEYAERINGRFAMVGFAALLVLELFTRQDFFTWIGL